MNNKSKENIEENQYKRFKKVNDLLFELNYRHLDICNKIDNCNRETKLVSLQ